MNVKTDITNVESVTREKAAHSQSEALVLMCSCASGGLEPSASFLRTSHCGTNMADVEDEGVLVKAEGGGGGRMGRSETAAGG